MDGTDVVYDQKPSAVSSENGNGKPPKPTKPTKPTSWQTQQAQAQTRLQALFQQAAVDVRIKAAQLEENVLRPAGEYGSELARSRPILATFLAIFLLLSLPSILTFLAFAILTTLTILATALFISLLLLGLILTGGFLLLLGALAIAFGMAIGLTGAVVGAYVVLSLVGHVRASGVQPGVGMWAGEMRGRATGGYVGK